MPYARISLLKGKSLEYRRALSDNLHRALVEAFDVPNRCPQSMSPMQTACRSFTSLRRTNSCSIGITCVAPAATTMC
uniref:4-oxalocrotonate tautomerase-like domain-containing protein n=1 Tax=mine drainage metagenome TaxID=410659 RepID=E6PQC7_9ZZZZ